MTAEQILAQLEQLEAAAPTINSKCTGAIGGSSFKLADVI